MDIVCESELTKEKKHYNPLKLNYIKIDGTAKFIIFLAIFALVMLVIYVVLFHNLYIIFSPAQQ